MIDLKHFFCLIALVLLMPAAGAQNFYVIGGTVHTAAGDVIENAAIVVEDGRIVSIADARVIRIDMNFGPVIEANGKHVYPGLIAPFTTLGLNEVDYLKQTRDFNEVGQYTPNVRALIAYNADSRVIPTVRSNGILYTQIVPEGGVVTGSSSVMKMQAWNWEDAVVKADDGIHMWWPKKFTTSGWWANPGTTSANSAYKEKVAEIETFLQRAKSYLASDRSETDLVLEAMEGVFSGSQNFYIHVHGAAEIVASVALMEEVGIPNTVLVGGAESGKVLDLLAEKDIPVMLTCIHKLPPKQHNDYDHWFKLPALLQEAGVRFCLTYGDLRSTFYGAWESRSLPFLAGTAAAFGLDREEALASISKNAAEIMRLDYTGTIEEGGEATFIISEGDLLDMRTSNITHAWIKGEPVDLGNKQKDLYAKWRGKYVEEGLLERGE